MAQATVNVRMDANLKAQFDALCTALGMDMSTAIKLFATTSVREQRIPFALALDPFYGQDNMKRILRAKEQLDSLGGTEHELLEEQE